MVSDGTYGSLAMLHPGGWIVVDAPPTITMITGSFTARTTNTWCDYGPGSCGPYADPAYPTLFSILNKIAGEKLNITHLVGHLASFVRDLQIVRCPTPNL